RLRSRRVERRRRIGILEIFEDESRIEEGEIAVDQHWDLTLGIGRQHVGMLGRIARRLGERHHHPLELERFLGERDLDLAGEEAERAGIELHSRLLRWAWWRGGENIIGTFATGQDYRSRGSAAIAFRT